MRRVLVGLAAAVLLAGCSSKTPSAITPGTSHVDVSSSELVTFKKHTEIPNCPRVTGGEVTHGMPSVSLPCLGGGRPVDLAGLRGPMIVNFWASWCGPCREELPALAAYARSQRTVSVVGIDYSDTQPGAALQLAKGSHVGYPLVADPGQTLDHAGNLPHIPLLPFTVFVGPDGSIVKLLATKFDSRAQVAAAAHDYLGVPG